MSIIIFNDKTPQPFVHQKPHVLVEFNRFLGKSIYLGFYLFLDQGINLFVFSSLKILIGISSHQTSWLCNDNLPTITICFDNITKITRKSYLLNLISKEMFVVVYRYTGWKRDTCITNVWTLTKRNIISSSCESRLYQFGVYNSLLW